MRALIKVILDELCDKLLALARRLHSWWVDERLQQRAENGDEAALRERLERSANRD